MDFPICFVSLHLQKVEVSILSGNLLWFCLNQMRVSIALADCAGPLGAEDLIQFPPVCLHLLFWLIVANFFNEVFKVFLQ